MSMRLHLRRHSGLAAHPTRCHKIFAKRTDEAGLAFSTSYAVASLTDGFQIAECYVTDRGARSTFCAFARIWDAFREWSLTWESERKSYVKSWSGPFACR
jgi:hypothetical protein